MTTPPGPGHGGRRHGAAGKLAAGLDRFVPGMPPAARSAVTSQAQGIPLFAVETVRALIDRDIVRPVEGVYQLTGDVGELVRAAERAARTGAAGRAATSYATAAELSQLAGEAHQADTGLLWENAAQAAILAVDYAEAIQHAGRAHDYHLDHGQARAAARTQATAGRALRLWGRLAEAPEQLTAALRVLRADPDADTVHALDELAALGVHSGSPDADRLSAEALILGQALGVGRDQLGTSFVTRGIYLISVERRRARLAGRDDGQPADAAFAAAIASLRQQSTPYHLAHGLLDHAEHLLGRGYAEGAAAAIEEARGIGTGLHCEPLLTRADAIEHAKPRIPA